MKLQSERERQTDRVRASELARDEREKERRRKKEIHLTSRRMTHCAQAFLQRGIRDTYSHAADWRCLPHAQAKEKGIWAHRPRHR